MFGFVQIREELRANGIDVYPQKEFDEDAEDRMINDKIRVSPHGQIQSVQTSTATVEDVFLWLQHFTHCSNHKWVFFRFKFKPLLDIMSFFCLLFFFGEILKAMFVTKTASCSSKDNQPKHDLKTNRW